MSVKVRERPKGSGVYWIFIDHNGKRKAKKVGDKKTANALAKKVQHQLAGGELGLLQDEKQNPLFESYATYWLEHTRGLVKQATYDLYETLDLPHLVVPMFVRERLLV